MEYLNRSKEQRARDVIANPRQFDEESVEQKALAKAKAEKLEDEALVERIYVLLGGALQKAVPETKTGVIAEEVSGKEVEEVGKRTRRKRE